MPSKKLLSKPNCGCPTERFSWKTIVECVKEGNIFRDYSYEVKICSTHNLPWGKRRKEIIKERGACEISLSNAQDRHLQPLKKIFAQLAAGNVAWTKWVDETNNAAEEIARDLIQWSILERISVTQSNGRKRTYLQIRSESIEPLSELLGYVSVSRQIALARQYLENALSDLPVRTLPVGQEILYRIIRKQLDSITQNNPGWRRRDGKIIRPKSALSKPPSFLIIAAGFSTWVRIWRPVITIREISARAFQSFPIQLEIYSKKRFKDPSKILEHFARKIQEILEIEEKSSPEQVGLIAKPEFFHCSGGIRLRTSHRGVEEFQGSIISLSNLLYTEVEQILLLPTYTRVLMIENLAVFAQIVHDQWAIVNHCLVIFISGKGPAITKYFPQLICEGNPNVEIWIWVDHDLGGCEIYENYAREIGIHRCKYVQIPPVLNPPYRPNSPEILSDLTRLSKSENVQLALLAQSVFKKGKIEQEYFLGDYQSILDWNFGSH